MDYNQPTEYNNVSLILHDYIRWANASDLTYTTTSSKVSLPTDTGDNSLFSTLDILLNCVTLQALSLLGIVGNLINILILSQHGFKQTTNILLTSLSVSDLLCSFLQPLRRLQCVISQFDSPTAVTFRTFSTAYISNLVDICISLSICHVTAIAVERFTAVFLPLRVSRIFTPSRVKWTILFIYLYTLTLLAPLFARMSYQWVYDATFNTTISKLTYSQFYLNNFDTFNVFTRIFINNLFSSFPLIVILVCSVAILVKLVSADPKLVKAHTVTADAKKIKDVKVAKMLLAVCLVTLTAYLPTAIIYMCLMYANITILSSGNIYYLLQSVIFVLYQLNASSNFFIYVTMSSKFASTYRQIFCSKK